MARVESWLADARVSSAGATIVVIGHRATHYGVEHLLRGVPLRDAVVAPWSRQPGWTCQA